MNDCCIFKIIFYNALFRSLFWKTKERESGHFSPALRSCGCACGLVLCTLSQQNETKAASWPPTILRGGWRSESSRTLLVLFPGGTCKTVLATDFLSHQTPFIWFRNRKEFSFLRTFSLSAVCLPTIVCLCVDWFTTDVAVNRDTRLWTGTCSDGGGVIDTNLLSPTESLLQNYWSQTEFHPKKVRMNRQ